MTPAKHMWLSGCSELDSVSERLFEVELVLVERAEQLGEVREVLRLPQEGTFVVHLRGHRRPCHQRQQTGQDVVPEFSQGK